MFSGSSWTTASVLEPATRSFVSLINFERKYMKAKVKTRTDFQASLYFGENKKKFNSRVPKPQARKGLYLTSPHAMSSWKIKKKEKETNPTQNPNNSIPSPPPNPTLKTQGSAWLCLSGSPMLVPTKPITKLWRRVLHKPYDFGADSRFYLVFTAFDEQMCDLNQTNQGFTHWTLSKTMRGCTAIHHCRSVLGSFILQKGRFSF